jgi:hypothetical protein
MTTTRVPTGTRLQDAVVVCKTIFNNFDVQCPIVHVDGEVDIVF